MRGWSRALSATSDSPSLSVGTIVGTVAKSSVLSKRNLKHLSLRCFSDKLLEVTVHLHRVKFFSQDERNTCYPATRTVTCQLSGSMWGKKPARFTYC